MKGDEGLFGAAVTTRAIYHEGMQERRGHARYAIWFPVQIATEPAEGRPGDALAVAKDAGAGGISISAAVPFEVGVKVTVRFRVPADTGEEQRAEGTIVRMAQNPDDPHGTWPYRMAIAFETPIPELEARLRDVCSVPPPPA